MYTYNSGGRIDTKMATTPALEIINIECLTSSSYEYLKNKAKYREFKDNSK